MKSIYLDYKIFSMASISNYILLLKHPKMCNLCVDTVLATTKPFIGVTFILILACLLIILDRKCAAFLLYLFPFIRFDTQAGTLDCDLWPPRSASWQTDPGGRAEDQASSERRQHHRGGPSPGQPDVPHEQGLPNTAAGGAAHRISIGRFIA